VVALLLPALRAVLPAVLPRVDEIQVDWVTVAGVAAAVVVSTLAAGFIPAWLGARDREHVRIDETHTATIAPGGRRLRAVLMGVQFALVSALLIAGAMLVRSFWNIMSVDKGFEAGANVYAVEIQVMHPGYRDEARLGRFERELLRRVRELNGVEAASLTTAIPLRGTDLIRNLQRPDGQPPLAANERRVDPAYFEVMKIPLLSGRWLTDADASGAEPVALVSQSLAMALYPGENPLGRLLSASSPTRIVGVVGDVRARSLLEGPMPAYYVPRAQASSLLICLVVRTRAALQQLGADLGRVVHDLDPEQPIQRLATLDQILRESVSDPRAYAVISTAFALLMLLLAGVGLGGHLTHVVAERARDLAIRSTLGASPRQQVGLLVRHVTLPLLGGIGAPVLTVYVVSPLAAPFLFELGRLDTASCVAAALLVGGLTAAAVFVPARRLCRLDVATLLRSP
jgi:putative ABC transport system permease protein